MFLWTAFTIGLLGSMHCVGMCAPIALSLPYSGHSRFNRWSGILLYNSGRLVTYSLIGLVFGLLGKGLFIANLQQLAAILTGVGLLLIFFFSFNIEHYLIQNKIIGRFYFTLKSQLAKLMRQPKRSTLFFIGILNGFLPCGLVYMALVGALSTGSAINGMIYMALFGLGTFPLMIMAGLSGQMIGLKFRKAFQKIYPVFLLGFALLFLMRGFAFDLPKGILFWEALQQSPIMCH